MESLDVGYDDTRFTSVIDEDLHCAICLNVLKEPMQCQTNEHHFCASCIKRHLENFQTCPSCKEQLTLDTLKKPSRFLARSLSELIIRCEYVDRGCSEVMSLFDLKTHSANCEYSPVSCSNEGCNEVINKREKMHHESQTCRFRKLKCDDCRETRKDIDEIKVRLGEISELKCQMSQIIEQINCLSQTVKKLYPQNTSRKGDIFVAGGRNLRRLNSAEKFSWSSRSWQQLQSMREIRSGPSSVVYENKMVVTGGRCGDAEDTDSMESLNFDSDCNAREWCNILPKLPLKLSTHQTVIYKNRFYLIGGCDNLNDMVFDSIYEVFLTAPYLSNLVGRMPQPVCYHGAEQFGPHIFIFGGSLIGGTVTDAVIKYNIETHECTNMPPLRYAARSIATVKWNDKVLVLGGESANGAALSTVVMYNIKTGENSMLPNMKYKRIGCSAVITDDDTIVVMGGWNRNDAVLRSVELFTFHRYCWEELPSMIERRYYATAVVKCINFA